MLHFSRFLWCVTLGSPKPPVLDVVFLGPPGVPCLLPAGVADFRCGLSLLLSSPDAATHLAPGWALGHRSTGRKAKANHPFCLTAIGLEL